MKPPPDDSKERQMIMRIVMIIVAVWGCTMALGITLFGANASRESTFAPSITRGAIAFAFVAAFMGLWFMALGRRKSKKS